MHHSERHATPFFFFATSFQAPISGHVLRGGVAGMGQCDIHVLENRVGIACMWDEFFLVLFRVVVPSHLANHARPNLVISLISTQLE